jgi:hypothetical protein
MKNIKTKTLAIFFAFALLTSATFADPGDMGGGGFAAHDEPVTASDTQTDADGDMGGGGRSSGAQQESYIQSVLAEIGMYLDAVL